MEQSTRGQRHNAEWVQLHTTTITSSNFKRVVTSKKWSDALVKSLFSPTNLDHIPAIKHGKLHEDIARDAYCTFMSDTAQQPVEFQECGLVLHTRFCLLGASPDGLVFDLSSASPYGLLEIKCPHQPFLNGQTVQEACSNTDFCCRLVDEQVRLKHNHQYFYQVQGQLAVCNAQWCDFM